MEQLKLHLTNMLLKYRYPQDHLGGCKDEVLILALKYFDIKRFM